MKIGRVVFAAVVYSLCAGGGLQAQDNMNPPGPPGSNAAWVKPLSLVEPRTMITNIPCSIATAGSYYLVSNLVGRSGFHGIIIGANDVKLDLNGFALIGVPGSYSGIHVQGTTLSNITIQNGAVRAWGWWGVNANVGRGIEATGLKAYSNGQGGLCLGDNAIVKECNSFDNTGGGMEIGDNAVLIDCEARSNSNIGISVGNGGKVRGCTAFANTTHGIYATSNATISVCSAIQNTKDGIQFVSGCRVADNHCIGNGAGSGTGAGIHATGPHNRIEENHASLNDYRIQTDIGTNLVIRNSASGNGTSIQNNYVLAPGTHSGKVLETEYLGLDFALGSPWTNFSY